MGGQILLLVNEKACLLYISTRSQCRRSWGWRIGSCWELKPLVRLLIGLFDTIESRVGLLALVALPQLNRATIEVYQPLFFSFGGFSIWELETCPPQKTDFCGEK